MSQLRARAFILWISGSLTDGSRDSSFIPSYWTPLMLRMVYEGEI